MIELEVTLVFLTTIFFTLIWIMRNFKIFWGILSSASWMTVGMMWLVITPMESHYSIALFFWIVGFLFLVIVIVQYINRLKVKRGYREPDGEDWGL